jgi:hypothetical protein
MPRRRVGSRSLRAAWLATPVASPSRDVQLRSRNETNRSRHGERAASLAVASQAAATSPRAWQRSCFERAMRASFLLAVSLASLALLAIAVRLAWIGDDAWITLRTVENLARGDGMRWNTVDRVQTFTHPLWLLLLAAARVVSGEVYVTTIVVSLLASTAAIVGLFANARSAVAVIAVAIVLAGTRAFVDFTSSGLETPLTACLLVAFVHVAASGHPPARRFGTAVLLASLLATARLDLVLLVGPAVLALARGVPWRGACSRLVVASAPLWGWLVFATIWFGHPLPVTAHSKLFDVGVPQATLVAQGAFYVWFALVDDPLLVATIVAGIGLAIANARARWLAAGMVLYVGYVIRIGGDFMAGRMLLPPFVVAVAMESSCAALRRGSWRLRRKNRRRSRRSSPTAASAMNAGSMRAASASSAPNARSRTSIAPRTAGPPPNVGSGSWALRASPAFAPAAAVT